MIAHISLHFTPWQTCSFTLHPWHTCSFTLHLLADLFLYTSHPGRYVPLDFTPWQTCSFTLHPWQTWSFTLHAGSTCIRWFFQQKQHRLRRPSKFGAGAYTVLYVHSRSIWGHMRLQTRCNVLGHFQFLC